MRNFVPADGSDYGFGAHVPEKHERAREKSKPMFNPKNLCRSLLHDWAQESFATMAENQSLQNFDWDAYEKESKGTQNEETLKKYDDTLSAIKDHEVVEGTVTSINKREVVVNVGYKSDGIVPASEFRYNPDLKVGDKVEVYVESQEDKNGQLVLSHKEARAARSWDRVNEALANEEIVKGYIKCRTKGGMIVDILGTEAFLPGSHSRLPCVPICATASACHTSRTQW